MWGFCRGSLRSAPAQRYFAGDESAAMSAVVEHQRAIGVDADHFAARAGAVGEHHADGLAVQRMPALPLGHERRKAFARVAVEQLGQFGCDAGKQQVAIDVSIASY